MIWPDEQEDGYRDEIFEEREDDNSDFDQQELEAMLYAQIHYDTNPVEDNVKIDSMKNVVCSLHEQDKDNICSSVYSTRADIELNKLSERVPSVLSAKVFENSHEVLDNLEKHTLNKPDKCDKHTKKKKKDSKTKSEKRFPKKKDEITGACPNVKVPSFTSKSVKERVIILSSSDFEVESPHKTSKSSKIREIDEEGQDLSVVILDDTIPSDGPCVISDSACHTDSVITIESSPDAVKKQPKNYNDGKLAGLSNMALSLSDSSLLNNSESAPIKIKNFNKDTEIIMDSIEELCSSGSSSDSFSSSDSETEKSFSDDSYDLISLDDNVRNSVEDVKLMNVNGITIRSNTEEAMLKEVLNSLSDGNWQIDDDDISPGKAARRYYGKSNIVCKNCDNKGHIAKNCPSPLRAVTCSLCATKGHQHWKCPQSLCHNCDHPGHLSHDCSEPWRTNKEPCYRCGTTGHFVVDCPDLWRQFHLTIKRGSLVRGHDTINEKIYCYNCARQGHFGHECNQRMVNHYTIAPVPFIIKYQLPTELKTSRHAHSHHSSDNHRQKHNQQHIDQYSENIKKHRKSRNLEEKKKNNKYKQGSASHKNKEKSSHVSKSTHKRKRIEWDEEEGGSQSFKRNNQQASSGHQRVSKKQKYHSSTVDLTSYEVSIPNDIIKKGNAKRKKSKKKGKCSANTSDLHADIPFSKKRKFDKERDFKRKELGAQQSSKKKKSLKKSQSRLISTSSDRGFVVKFHR